MILVGPKKILIVRSLCAVLVISFAKVDKCWFKGGYIR